MEVVLSDSAREFLVGHGGVAFVRAHSYRCCSVGSLTLLDIDTRAPKDADCFVTTTCDVDVRILLAAHGAPDQLIIDTRGRLRPRLVAFWDNCAFKA
ncbi:MAG: hypothetical protein WCA31_01625 [Acidimicrobiales bacterium]